MGEAVVKVSDSDFQAEVLSADRPTLVDFWAPWCGPCKALAPLIDELAEAYRDKIKVAKVNTDENHKTAAAYGVRSIPTLILFKEGKVVDTLVGLVSKEKLEAFVQGVL